MLLSTKTMPGRSTDPGSGSNDFPIYFNSDTTALLVCVTALPILIILDIAPNECSSVTLALPPHLQSYTSTVSDSPYYDHLNYI